MISNSIKYEKSVFNFLFENTCMVKVWSDSINLQSLPAVNVNVSKATKSPTYKSNQAKTTV